MKCGNEIYYLDLCKKCFCISIEKKVSKEATSKLEKNDAIIVVNDNSNLSRLNWHFVKIFATKVPCSIVFDSLNDFKKVKNIKIINPLNMEDELKIFVNFLEGKSEYENYKINRNDDQKNSEIRNEINILISLSEEECAKYAEAKKIKYKKRTENDELMKMINKIEEKYPGRKIGVLKSIEQTNDIIRRNKNY